MKPTLTPLLCYKLHDTLGELTSEKLDEIWRSFGQQLAAEDPQYKSTSAVDWRQERDRQQLAQGVLSTHPIIDKRFYQHILSSTNTFINKPSYQHTLLSTHLVINKRFY